MPIYPGTFHNKPLFNDDGTIAVLNRCFLHAQSNSHLMLRNVHWPQETIRLMVDIFKIGLEDTDDLTSSTNNAIYRLELEEDGDNSSDFIGTLEYIGLNQVNVAELATYTSIDAISNEITFISDDSSISVEYFDLDSTGGETVFTAEADTPTHSGSVSLDSDGYKVSDTVMVTVEDADLNTDSSRTDLYTTSGDRIGSTVLYAEGTDDERVLWDEDLLTVSIDGEAWAAGCGLGGLDSQRLLRSGRPGVTAACSPAHSLFRHTTAPPAALMQTTR